MRYLSSPSSTVVLTGGTAGIGKVLCDRLIAQGCTVVVLARGAADLAPAPRLHRVPCDLSDQQAVRSAIARIAVAHPDIGIVINNAALQYDRPLGASDFDADRMVAEVAVNLLAPALIVQGLLATMQAHGRPAAIVNVNSGLAFFPKRRTALYCATKAGLRSFSQSLRYQFEGTPIDVVDVFLPLVDTGMTAGRGRGKMRAAAAADAILAGVFAGRRHVWVGKAALVPILDRLAPALGRAILKGPA